MTIYTIRTTSGREDIVIDMLESGLKASNNPAIKSISHPAEIKGYVFVEGSLGAVQRAMHGLMHAKGLIEKPVALDEIRHFLERKKTMMKISEGDTAEIIGGPFKGERGEIKRIDKVKSEVTIELLEASIPIPITIATEFIKIVKKAKPDEEGEERPAKPVSEKIAEEAPVEEEKEEGSAFDIESVKEQEEEREEKKEAAKKRISLEELRKQMAEEEAEAKPARAAADAPLIPAEAEKETGSIIDELEKEESEKKKKRLKDLEDLEFTDEV